MELISDVYALKVGKCYEKVTLFVIIKRKETHFN